MKRLQPFVLVLVLLTIAILPKAYCQTDSTWVDSTWTQGEGTWEGAAPDTSGNVVVGALDTTENLAFGKNAVDITGASVPKVTDGKTTSEWKSGEVDALHYFLTVDLETNRLVDSVRVLPKKRQEYKFIKGYSIKLSTDNVSWTIAAMDLNLTATEIGTSFTPQVARYVKIEIENIDKINEVVVAEIEVYGRGFLGQGTYTSSSKALNPGTAVVKNFGIASWEADVPEDTDLSIQFRTGDSKTPGGAWSEWSEEYRVSTGVLFTCFEPRKYLQYKVNLSTTDPSVSPCLKELSIKYSTFLLATNSSASIKVVADSINAAPDTVTVGRLTDLVYTMDFEFDEDSKGFHEIFIATPNKAEVTDCYFVSQDTIQIPVTGGYTWSSTNEGITIELPATLREDTTLAVDFRIKLYDEQNDFPAMALNRASSPENPQFVDQQGTDAWRVVTTGCMEKVLLEVEADPNPFSPNGDKICDYTRFKYTVAKIAVPREVTISVFNLSGKLVWEHKETQLTGDYEPQWDGKDNDGELVNPGLYIFRIKVKADETSISTGTIVVAY